MLACLFKDISYPNFVSTDNALLIEFMTSGTLLWGR